MKIDKKTKNNELESIVKGLMQNDWFMESAFPNFCYGKYKEKDKKISLKKLRKQLKELKKLKKNKN